MNNIEQDFQDVLETINSKLSERYVNGDISYDKYQEFKDKFKRLVKDLSHDNYNGYDDYDWESSEQWSES